MPIAAGSYSSSMRAKDGNGNKTYIFDRSETYQYDSSCARKMAAEFQSKEDILIFANCNTADHSIQLNILVFVFFPRGEYFSVNLRSGPIHRSPSIPGSKQIVAIKNLIFCPSLAKAKNGKLNLRGRLFLHAQKFLRIYQPALPL